MSTELGRSAAFSSKHSPMNRQTELKRVPPCTTFDLFLWLLRRRSRVRIVGRSMWPVLRPGDEVFIKSFKTRNSPLVGDLAVGDIVTLWHPTQPDLKIVKRITQIETFSTTRRRYFVQGDNPAESTDSRQFGWIHADQLLGQVICRFDRD